MAEVEKNDVDIEKLFRWGRVYEVVDPTTNDVAALVYMRLLGDADANKARVYALRKSAELRKELLTPGTDQNIILIRDINEMTETDLINYITVFSLNDFKNEAYKEVKIKKPVQPRSDAKLEKQEKYQKEIDDYPKKFLEAVENYIKKSIESLRKSLEGTPMEELYGKYKIALIDDVCEREALNSYGDMETYLGCFKDEEYRERFFSSIEQFLNLDTKIKNDFKAAYSTLQVSSQELKKLQVATH